MRRFIFFLFFFQYSIFILPSMGNQEPDSNFNWRAAEGDSIRVFLNQHPLGEAIIRKLPEFEELTGIKVLYSITPEDSYFDKVSTALSSRSGNPDIFMVGAYQIWQYAHAGYIQDLDLFFNNTAQITPGYDREDFFPEVIEALRWDGIPGHSVGSGTLWGLPLVFETNSLAYNKRIFDERNLEPPETMDELLRLCDRLQNFDGPDTYALAVRRARHWSTIHAGYMTTFTNYGARDYELVDGALISRVDSRESVEATEMWLNLIKRGGVSGSNSYSWSQAGADLGAGKAAMLFDADNNSFYQNQFGTSKEAGNIRWVKAPAPDRNGSRSANMWIWALSMNESSQNKLASWLFLQYFTGREFSLLACTDYKGVDPPRHSVYYSSEFQEVLKKSPGYNEVFQTSLPETRIMFTPQPYFMEMALEWASVLQDLASGRYGSTEEGLRVLKNKMDEIASRQE